MRTLAFPEHVHHVLINGEFIFLDEVRDRYVFLDRRASDDLLSMLQSDEADHDGARQFVERGLLRRAWERQYISTVRGGEIGVDNYEWRLSTRFRNASVGRGRVLRMAFRLLRTRARLRRGGLHSALEALRRRKRILASARRAPLPLARQRQVADEAAYAVALASAYLPFRVQCLESSIALTDRLLAVGIGADMKIGVQRYDFLAHAWVEVLGRVVGDDPNLPLRLPAILVL